jgi:hypothetical protein
VNLRTNRLWSAIAIATLLTWQVVAAQQGQVLDRVPPAPDMKARYVIYLHGRIIEDRGRRPNAPHMGDCGHQMGKR